VRSAAAAKRRAGILQSNDELDDTVPLTPGARLGTYEIVAAIGAGGMGEVYRARDGKLNRDVAIKVLSSALAEDPAALARFEREAQSVAQLSHPNILNIFDFGREGSIAYAAMELLEGETLRERIAAGVLAPRKAIDYAVQIAHGLAAAHDKGLVHRDLKPENVFITRGDRVKILDFGLAKPFTLGAAGVTVADTVGTAAGTVMGTVGYMAPEQVRGRDADHRADIFAFGSVLYEMISGRRAFGGETAADSISAILNNEPPDLDTLSEGMPPALDRIIRRCLEKTPELRFQSAHDLAFALETISSRGSGATAADVAASPRPAPSPRRTSSQALPWLIAALAVIAAVVSWTLASRTPAREIPWQSFTAITDTAGVETAPSLSPDGNTVAYATRAHGTWDIYVQRVGGRTAIAVADDQEQEETGPAFSPDGLQLAYYVATPSGGIFVAGATGESARRVTDFGFHPAWSPDGKRITFTAEEITSPYNRNGISPLWVVDTAGGAPTQVSGAGDAAQPAWSPSGARIAYWSNTGGQRDVYTIAVAGGARTAVTNDAALDWDPTWSPDGRYLYFASDRGGSMNIWRIAVDDQNGNVTGRPEPVTTGVQASSEMPAFSKDGARLAFRSGVSASNPTAIPFDPVTLRAGVPVTLNNSNTSRRPTDVSRDGRRLALANLGERQEDLFVSALDGSGLRRVTDDAARDRVPVWSPDGKSLFFYSNRDGDWNIWSIGADGGGLRKVAASAGPGLLYPILSPAGDRVVSSTSIGAAGSVYMSSLAAGVVAAGNVKELPGTTQDGQPFSPTAWSPDGARLAGYFSNSQSGRPVRIGVYDLATSAISHQFDVASSYVRWLPDSRRLVFFTPDGRLMVLDVASKALQQVDVKMPRVDVGEFALAPDARTIYYGAARFEADIWIVERK
jgi:Tol biopolymer transport system component/serine/threonine protein kinase